MNKKNQQVIKNEAPSIYPTKTKVQVTIIFFIVLALYVISMSWTQSQMAGGFSGFFSNMYQVFAKFFPPNPAVVPAIWQPMVETIQMAMIATTFAAIVTVPLALFAAENINTIRPLYYIARTFLNILRTIPDLVLAVIFVGLFGIGLFPGILALFIFSIGILAKLISETIESVDMDSLEAMRSSGANIVQMVWYALIPQVLPQYVSLVLYVFEINIRASVVLGLVGAGGIGLILNQQLGFYNYPNAMMIIIIIFIVVILIEYMSNKIREALI